MSEWFMILSMSVLTFTPRYLPFALAGKVKIPPIIEKALTFVPTAVLTSIITQSTIIRDGEIAFNLGNHHLIAILAACLTALIFKRLFVIVLLGMFAFLISKWLF